MSEQESPAIDSADQKASGPAPIGWGFWPLWVLALAGVGALSYLAGTLAPLSEFALPPAALVAFGLLAGGVHGFALRRWIPPARRWLLASALAGALAALVSILPTALAKTPAGLLAGWAYAWAAYGAVLGLLLQRVVPGRWWMLASLAGWALAGMLSGAVGWALDVFQVTDIDPMLTSLPATSRIWSLAGLALMGVICGATGGAITGAALVLLSRARTLLPEAAAAQAKYRKLVLVAGALCGLVAAALCTYLAPLLLTILVEGSLDSLDLTIYALSAAYSTPVCIPTIALVSIPLGIGCGHVGLEMAGAGGRSDPRPWIWCGAVVGGVLGYLLGNLVAVTIGYL